MILVTCLTSMFLGIQPGNQFVTPNESRISTNALFLIFIAVPWILANGFLGILPAMFLAGLSGLFLALWQTHNLFTIPELMLLSLLYGYAIRQNFRTPFFQFLRHPLGSSVFFALAYAPIYILTTFLATHGSTAVRLDEALTQTWPLMFTRGLELIVAGLLIETLYMRRAKAWFVPNSLIPSPIEQSLQLKFLFATVPFLFGLLISLAISSWVMARNIAFQLARESLLSDTQSILGGLTEFLKFGQTQLDSYSNSKLINSEYERQQKMLRAYQDDSGFFISFYLVDHKGNFLAASPDISSEEEFLTHEEKSGLAMVLQEHKRLVVADPNAEGDCVISFLVPVIDQDNKILGALLGRTNYAANPNLTQLFATINTFERSGGDLVIINGGVEDFAFIYPGLAPLDQDTLFPTAVEDFELVERTGEKSMVVVNDVDRGAWSLMLVKPYSQILEQAFKIAFPLLLALLIFVFAAIVSLVLSLSRVSGSLKYLSDETSRIARGELGSNVPVRQVDEVGQLSKSFEQMRSSLRLRMEELNRLLAVSKGVASSLEIKHSLQAVLKDILETGASSARIVLVSDVSLDVPPDGLVSLSAGPLAEIYTYFDKPIFDSMRHQELLLIPKPSRMHRLPIPEDLPKPSSLIARALFHEDRYFGAIWAAYEQPKDFSDEELRYFSVLAGQASLAAANAALFCSTEIGRQRLDAVISSAPEPMMVFNEIYQLLLMNSAARDLDFLIKSSEPGSKVEDVIESRELIMMIKRPDDLGTFKREIHFPNKKVYQAIVSPVFVEKQIMGKVCILREVTEYKQLEALKSEFVSTVSHDLRSPLTMLKGYTTMLPMVGELNDQQREYLKKITTGIDGMTHLVNNLLDLGRIEAGVGLKLELIQPASIIEKIVKMLQPQAVQKNIQVSYHSDEIPGSRIQADPALLQQALFNLVENAIKFTNVGGKVEIKRTESENSVRISVRDTGIGIAPIDLDGIFDRSKSLSRGDQKLNGAGLGLSIVRSIAEKHDGKVWVESQLGKGSIFYLELPRHQIKG